MGTEALAAFWEAAKRDSAIQEQVRAASKQPDMVGALVGVAASAGFDFTAAELEASLSTRLSDAQLDSVVGGTDALTEMEFFANCYAARLRDE